MTANHAYGLIGLIAHNFIRTLALLDNPQDLSSPKQFEESLSLSQGKLFGPLNSTG
jgi:hypothetical protein